MREKSAKKKAAAKKKRKAPPKSAAPAKRRPAPKRAARKRAAAAGRSRPERSAAKRSKRSPAPKKKTKKKKTGAAKAKRAPTPQVIPPPRPSDRAMAVAAQLPQERALTDEEREAMTKVAQTALAAIEIEGSPEVIVTRIGGFVDEVRAGRRPEPNNQDVRLGIGVLWGEQLRAQVGWRWVHLSYPNGFASYALVPDDRAFACFPLNRLSELMKPGAEGVNTSIPLFDSIRDGVLPTRRENAYLVIG